MKVNISELLGDDFIQNSDMEEVENKIYNDAKLIFERVEKINKYYNYLVSEIRKLDNATKDILHYIEITENLNAPEGYKAYKLIRDIRRRRRKLKDDYTVIRPMWIAINQTGIDKRQKITLKNMKNACNTIEGKREYNTRVMTDLFGKTI